MSFFSSLFSSSIDEPVNVNDQSNHHLVTALVANQSAHDEYEKGTVAAYHVAEIAQRHLAISDSLDRILEAHEKAG